MKLKLWHNNTYLKQKCQGYKDGGKPHRFTFGNFFNSIILSLPSPVPPISPFCRRKNIFRKFLEDGLGIVSSSHFVYDFSKKIFFSCYALLTDQISLPDCLSILRYWSICVLQLLVNQVVAS